MKEKEELWHPNGKYIMIICIFRIYKTTFTWNKSTMLIKWKEKGENFFLSPAVSFTKIGGERMRNEAKGRLNKEKDCGW